MTVPVKMPFCTCASQHDDIAKSAKSKQELASIAVERLHPDAHKNWWYP